MIVAAAAVLLFIVCVAPCLMIIVHACTLPRWARGKGVCGKCGYQAGVIARCPECGSDIAEVGLVSGYSALRLRPSLGSAIGAWLFMMAVLGWASAGVTYAIVEQRQAGQTFTIVHGVGPVLIVIMLTLLIAAGGLVGILMRRRALKRSVA